MDMNEAPQGMISLSDNCRAYINNLRVKLPEVIKNRPVVVCANSKLDIDGYVVEGVEDRQSTFNCREQPPFTFCRIKSADEDLNKHCQQKLVRVL